MSVPWRSGGIVLLVWTSVAVAQPLDLSLPASVKEDTAAPPESATEGDPQRLPPVVVTAPHDVFMEADAKLKKLKDSLGCLGCDGRQHDPRPRAVQIGEELGRALFGLFSSYQPQPKGEANDQALSHAQAGISTYDNPGGGTVRPNQP